MDTRYPKLNIVFHNAGVPGDRVTGGYAGDAATRVTRNVTPFNPSVITVKLLREAAPDARTTLLEQAEFSLRVETSAGGKKSRTTQFTTKGLDSLKISAHHYSF